MKLFASVIIMMAILNTSLFVQADPTLEVYQVEGSDFAIGVCKLKSKIRFELPSDYWVESLAGEAFEAMYVAYEVLPVREGSSPDSIVTASNGRNYVVYYGRGGDNPWIIYKKNNDWQTMAMSHVPNEIEGQIIESWENSAECVPSSEGVEIYRSTRYRNN